MKRVLVVGFVAVLAGALGCNGQSTPGGPGATGSNRGPALTQADNTFKLNVPNLETDIEQGESKTITIGINRGTNFNQDVKLEFSGAPDKVKVTPASSEIKASQKEVQVTLEAAKDAALGEFEVTVNGTPAKEGTKATSKFKVQVKKAG